MKTFGAAFLFFILLFVSNIICAQATWTQMTSFAGTARIAAASFSIGTKGYLGTGIDASNPRQDFWEYDPATNAWTQRADFGGGPRFGAVSLSIGNKGYIGLGSATYPSYTWPTDFWEYDPVTNMWTQLANFPVLGRYTLASFVINNKAYMGTGWRGGPVFNDFWEYDPVTNLWTQKANFGGPARQSTTFFSVDSSGYVGLGAFNSTMYLDFWKYNPITDVWTQLNNFPGIGRRNPMCFSICNYGYTGLGSSTYPVVQNLNDLWQYAPLTDTWTQLQNFPGTARYNVTSFSLGNTGYVGTGQDNSGFNNHFWEISFPVAAAYTSPATACIGTIINFTNTSTGANSYYWDFGDLTTSTSQNPSHTYSAPGTYNVLLVATYNCSSDSVIQTVTINPDPVPVITGPTNFCQGDSVILTASGGTSYLWSTAANAASISVNASGTYTVTLTDANGCSSSTSETVIVYPMPVAILSPPGPLTVCGNNTVTLNVSPGASSYAWYYNNALMANEANSTLTTNAIGTYYVVITDVNGCTASSNAVIVVPGNTGPDVSITSSLANGQCAQNTIFIGYGPQSATLTANSPTAVSWLWSTGATTQSITVTTAGTYSVTVWDAGGCASPESPQSQITINAIDIRCGNGLKKILFCHVPEGNPGNPQTICIAPSAVPHHLEQHPGDCVGPCTLYYQREQIVSSEDVAVSIYPNPFNNSFTVAMEIDNDEPVLLNLYEVTGRIIFSGYRFTGSAELGAELNKGVYTIEILVGEKRKMYRIVKL